jgi:ribonuclease P protein component
MNERGGFISRCLFRKKDKIKSKKEIRDIVHNGIKKKCHYVNIYFKKRENSRLAIIVHKRDNNAVQRNKIKRKIREIFRKTNKKTCDYVLRVKMNIKSIKNDNLENEIKKIIGKKEK